MTRTKTTRRPIARKTGIKAGAFGRGTRSAASQVNNKAELL